MNNPNLNDAKNLAQKYDKDIVVIFHIDKEKFGYASYGNNKKLCKKAKSVADLCFDIIANHPDII